MTDDTNTPPAAIPGEGELAPLGWREKVDSFVDACIRHPHKAHIYASVLQHELSAPPPPRETARSAGVEGQLTREEIEEMEPDVPDRASAPPAQAADVVEEERLERFVDEVPDDPWKAFPFLVARCAEGFGGELIEAGKTKEQARRIIIGCFLDFAAGEACRVARKEGREPDHTKWRKATDDVFERAVIRTAPTVEEEA